MNKLDELAKEDFGDEIQKLLNDELSRTLDHVNARSHDKELSSLIQYYWVIRRSMPGAYRSKAGLPVRNYLHGFCEDLPFEYDDGVIENGCLVLEKQCWEAIFSCFIGSYRSVCISLRHMLQLSCWITQAVVNKEVLTKNPDDHNKAMSIQEFETFLFENDKLYSKTRSNDEFVVTERDRPLEGISLWDLSSDFPLHLITYKDSGGRKAISNLYGELSRYAHANFWKRVKLGPGKSEFLPTYTNKGFHKCLELIFVTHRLIFSLLILVGFHELKHNLKSQAYDFVKNIYTESNKYEFKFTKIIPILEYHLQIFSKNELKKEMEELESNDDMEYDEEDDYIEQMKFRYTEPETDL